MKRLNGNSPEVRRGTPLGRNGSDARKPRDTLKTRYGQVKLRNLDELDGRTAAAQKARAIVGRLVADAGGPDNITEGMRQLIQRAALLTLFVEDAEARWIAG